MSDRARRNSERLGYTAQSAIYGDFMAWFNRAQFTTVGTPLSNSLHMEEFSPVLGRPLGVGKPLSTEKSTKKPFDDGRTWLVKSWDRPTTRNS